MPSCITRVLRSMRRTHPPPHALTRLAELDSLRTAMLQAVHDCAGTSAQQLQLKIRSARTHRDLWMLRSDAYHLIALHHCQSVADQRIHHLQHLFEGWVAPQEIGRLS